MEKKKAEQKENLIDFLKAKKARDGRLSKYGEWLLENGGQTKTVKYDMRAVMK